MARYAERLAGQQAIRQVAEALGRRHRNASDNAWGVVGIESIIGFGLLVGAWKSMSFWEWLGWFGIFALTTLASLILTLLLRLLVKRRTRKRFDRLFPPELGEREQALAALRQFNAEIYAQVFAYDYLTNAELEHALAERKQQIADDEYRENVRYVSDPPKVPAANPQPGIVATAPTVTVVEPGKTRPEVPVSVPSPFGHAPIPLQPDAPRRKDLS